MQTTEHNQQPPALRRGVSKMSETLYVDIQAIKNMSYASRLMSCFSGFKFSAVARRGNPNWKVWRRKNRGDRSMVICA